MAKKNRPRPAVIAPPAAPQPRVPSWLAAAVMLASIGLCLRLNDGFQSASWPKIAASLFPPLWEMTGAALAGHAAALAAAAWLCAAFCGAGAFLLERLGLEIDDAWERRALSFGLGLGAWGTGLLLLGLAGLLYRPLLLALSVPSALPLLGWRTRQDPARTPAPPAAPLGMTGKICAAFFVLLLLTILPGVLVPETFYDALMYHLALPDLYLQHHRVFPTPYNLYAGIPSLPQMTFAAALAWDPWGIVARLVHFSLIPALAAAFMAAARRWERPDAGPLAACLLLAAPVMFFEASRVTVGAELALFQFLSFYCFVAACGLEAPARRRWLVLSGLFLGFACSTKYTSLVLPAAFLAAWAAASWRRAPAAPRARELALVFLVAAAVTAPWIVRNVAFYRDPLYPTLARVLRCENAGSIQLERMKTESGGQDLSRLLSEPARLASYLRLPWDMSLRYGKGDVDYPGPAFLMLLPALLLVPLSAPLVLMCALALGAWASLGLFTVLPRYFIPNLAAAALPLAWAARSLRPRWLRAGVAGAVLATGAANVLPLSFKVERNAAWPVLLGQRSRESFLAHGKDLGYVTPSYAGFRYLHEHAPPDARVLLFGDGRSFYLRRDSLGATVFNASPLEVWANASADAAALRARLSAEGISYLLVNRGEAMRNKSALGFTVRGREVCDAFAKRYLLKVFEVGSSADRWVIVYRLLDEAEAALPHASYDPFRAPVFTPETAPPVGDD